jgi:hypothetical protein
MNDNRRILIYLGSEHEVDQISPIIYKLGERDNIYIDVVLESGVSTSDYRIQAIDSHTAVTIINYEETNSQSSTIDQVFELVKHIGRMMPTNVSKKIYHQFPQPPSPDRLSIPDQLSDNEYGVIAFDWTHAKGERSTHFANRNDITTIVLPHGDSPFINNIEIKSYFDRFIKNDLYFTRHVEQNEIGYPKYEQYLKHDYILYPNDLTADRMPRNAPKDQIMVFGSPRYNNEWLSVLSEIRTQNHIQTEAEINAVFFLRRGDYFINKSEVEMTLNILNNFDKISTIVKEHPQGHLLSPTIINEMENIRRVTDEVSSASLIEWGDIFLSLGSTITFEPIMRQKPVLAVEYAHGNYTVVSDYFHNADMRCKDDLYHAVFDFLTNGTDNYYNKDAYQKFVDEMIQAGGSSVLDTWAGFIESKTR